MPITLGEHLGLYEALGFCVIPIQPAIVGDPRTGKRPILLNQPPDKAFLNWQPYTQRRSTAAEHDLWWPRRVRGAPIGGPGIQNIAVITGNVSNIVVLDIDDEESYTQLTDRIPELCDLFTVKSGRGYHLYMHPDRPNISTSTFKLRGHLHHIKAEGGYVVAPPSLHYTGNAYRLMADGVKEDGHYEAPELTTVDVNWLAQALVSAGVEVVQPSDDGPRNPPGWLEELLGEVIAEGGRHSALVRVAGHLAGVFGQFRGAQAMAWLELWNQARVNPPLPRGELEKALSYALNRDQSRRHAEPGEPGGDSGRVHLPGHR